MAADTDITMTNSSNSLQFLFRGVGRFKNKKSQPSLDIPLVNTNAAGRIIFRFTGQAQDVSFTFTIFDDGVDVSNGTHSSTVKTVAEQVQYIQDNFFTHEFDTTWTLAQTRHFASAITGVIDSIEIDNPAGAGTLIPGTLTFKRGAPGAL